MNGAEGMFPSAENGRSPAQSALCGIFEAGVALGGVDMERKAYTALGCYEEIWDTDGACSMDEAYWTDLADDQQEAAEYLTRESFGTQRPTM
ncbi:hypothetical protein ACHAWF_001130 [Thalassiosira exigua]